MSNYLKGLKGEVERAKAHMKWVAEGSKGMRVPFHSDLNGTPLSALVKLEWWLREIKTEHDKLNDLVAKIHDIVEATMHGSTEANTDCAISGLHDLHDEVLENYDLKVKIINFLDRFVTTKRCHGGGDPDHVCLWCDAVKLLKEING